MKTLFFLLLIALTATVAKAADPSANYPEKAIVLVVPFAAGGFTDITARDLSMALMMQMPGSRIVIENIAGDGGTRALAEVLARDSKGYTLLLHSTSIATAAASYRSLSFRLENDVEFLGLVNEVPLVLVGRSTLPPANYKELRSWIGTQTNPPVTIAHGGTGTASQLCSLLLQQTLADTQLIAMPFRGAGPTLTAVSEGRVDLLCDLSLNLTDRIEAKKVKAFAVTSPRRAEQASLKHLPSLEESGHTQMSATQWHGLYVRKGVPGEVLRKIHGALKLALKDSDFNKKQEALGAAVIKDGRVEPAEHKKFVVAEAVKWTPLIKKAGAFSD